MLLDMACQFAATLPYFGHAMGNAGYLRTTWTCAHAGETKTCALQPTYCQAQTHMQGCYKPGYVRMQVEAVTGTLQLASCRRKLTCRIVGNPTNLRMQVRAVTGALQPAYWQALIVVSLLYFARFDPSFITLRAKLVRVHVCRAMPACKARP